MTDIAFTVEQRAYFAREGANVGEHEMCREIATKSAEAIEVSRA